jgi:hypothetical protein
VYDKGIAKTIDISRRIKMFAIMEYVWKIRGQLKKDATSHDRLFEAIMGHKKQNVGQD